MPEAEPTASRAPVNRLDVDAIPADPSLVTTCAGAAARRSKLLAGGVRGDKGGEVTPGDFARAGCRAPLAADGVRIRVVKAEARQPLLAGVG